MGAVQAWGFRGHKTASTAGAVLAVASVTVLSWGFGLVLGVLLIGIGLSKGGMA